jgi:ribosomal protein L11 methyltransferase
MAVDGGAGRAAAEGRWLELRVTADPEAVEAVGEILSRHVRGGISIEPGFRLVDEGLAAVPDPTRPVLLRGYLPLSDPAAEAAAAAVRRDLGHLQAFGLGEIGELAVKVVEEAEWATAWKAHLPVLRVGRRLVVRPSWRRHRRRPDEVVVVIDPGMAFGTGLHPTTRLALTALEAAADEGWQTGTGASLPGSGTPRSFPHRAGRTVLEPATWRVGGGRRGLRVLDLGSGSGILGIAALKLGADAVLALDTDPVAVEATLANARRNGVARRLEARRGSLPSGEAPFHLVLANLVAGLIVELAPQLAAELMVGGELIVSGIVVERAAEVEAALEAVGLRLEGRFQEGEWVAGRWRRP